MRMIDGINMAASSMVILVLGLLASNALSSIGGQWDLKDATESVSKDAIKVAAAVPDASEFAVGRVNGEGEFEAFPDNVAPEGLTDFVFQVGNAEGVVEEKPLQKSEEVTLRVDPIEDVPGEFTVSAFSEDAKSAGPGFGEGEAVVYSSLLQDFED